MDIKTKIKAKQEEIAQKQAEDKPKDKKKRSVMDYIRRYCVAIVLTEMIVCGVVYMTADQIVMVYDKLNAPTSKTIIINQAQAKEIEVEEVKDNFVALADYIYLMESSRGVNDQKCERLGKHNGYGYGQGVGRNTCFDSDNETREYVIEWLKDKKEMGLSDQEMLCYYNTGIVAQSCEYIKHYKQF